MLDEAEGHLATERYEWALIRAQTACEMYARLALDRIAHDLPEDAGKGYRLFRRVTLLDSSDRALFRALTGKAIGAQEWWTSYRLHVERRNDIVHAGLSVSENEALASLEATRSFMRFLEEQWTHAARG